MRERQPRNAEKPRPPEVPVDWVTTQALMTGIGVTSLYSFNKLLDQALGQFRQQDDYDPHHDVYDSELKHSPRYFSPRIVDVIKTLQAKKREGAVAAGITLLTTKQSCNIVGCVETTLRRLIEKYPPTIEQQGDVIARNGSRTVGYSHDYLLYLKARYEEAHKRTGNDTAVVVTESEDNNSVAVLCGRLIQEVEAQIPMQRIPENKQALRGMLVTLQQIAKDAAASQSPDDLSLRKRLGSVQDVYNILIDSPVAVAGRSTPLPDMTPHQF
jgi:hypothetical protein